MKTLINTLKDFLGNRVEDVRQKGPAELEIVIREMENVERLSAEIKAHILELVDENTLAKINFVTTEGKEIDSFSLT
ncbi:MAG: hypothetical protein EOO86_13160, partial [Pedobacter sp.]